MGSRSRIVQGVVLAVAGLVALFLPYMTTPFWLNVAIDICAFAVLGISYNILLGRAGIFSFGHALFFGGGAYAIAAFTTDSGLPLGVAAVGGVLVATVLAVLVGLLVAHVRGIYFGMLTLAVAQVGFTIADRDIGGITGGENGLAVSGIPEVLNANVRQDILYWLSLAVLVAVLVLVAIMYRSAAGRFWEAIRENEVRAQAMGVNVGRHRLIVFSVAGALAGVAGVMHALSIQTVTPSDTNVPITVQALLITVIGGAGSFWGPVLGAVFVRLFPPVLDEISQTATIQELPDRLERAVTSQFLILGIIYILFVLYVPGGFSGAFNRLLGRLDRRPGPPSATPEPPEPTPDGAEPRPARSIGASSPRADT
ncbi:MAG TPA: branched-chain amino acid ABC transporter permease [Solirubrobacteraceae bacterium]|nr:branched-chain amino acid ABC transporter permease [Solirubrobacteraceae bacterium]